MPQIPIFTARRERAKRRIEDEVVDRTLGVIAKSMSDASLVEKAGALGAGGGYTNPAMYSGMMPQTSWSDQTTGVQSNLMARITSNVASEFQKPSQELEESLAEQGLSWGPAFPPGRPLDPYFGYRRPARTYDYPVGANVQITPRQNRVSFETIKAIYEAYDVAQICVRHLINDVRSLSYNWEPIPGIKDDVADDIERAIAFFDAPDKRQPFRAWLGEWLQDILRYDAGALYIRRNESGEPIALEVVDGTTVLPLVDFYGRRPEDEHDADMEPDGLFGGDTVPAYLQVVKGIPWDWLASDDLIYQPWNPLPDSQYGLAPLEAVLLSANTDIRFQWHFLQFFTEGTVPAGFMEAPPDHSDPAQLAHWQETWDAVMLGDQSKLRQVRWVPSGAKFTQLRPDAETFKEEFPLYLMRRTAAAFGVTPNDLGFTESVNRATGDTQIDVQWRVGVLPLLRHVEDVINLFVKQHLGLSCRIRFDDGQEVEDRVATAQALGVYVDHGVLSVDEVRQELGYPVDKSRPVGRFVNNTRSGPIPLLAIESMSGEVDAETYAPVESQKLVASPFAPPSGVLPIQKTPEGEQSAKDQAQQQRELVKASTGEYPRVEAERAVSGEQEPVDVEGAVKDNARQVTARPWELVLALLDEIDAAKETTAGMTVATGVQGYDLDGEMADDDDDDEVAKAAELALSLRRWRENSRNRLRKGKAPKRFSDPVIPSVLADELWVRLAKARTRGEVDAVFADAGKPQAGQRPAFHSQADRIVDYYAPRVRKATGSIWTHGHVESALREAYASSGVSKAQSGKEFGAPVKAFVKKLTGSGNLEPLKNVMKELYGNSFLQGVHDAAKAAGSDVWVNIVKGFGVAPPESYWDAWTPGSVDFANTSWDGGLKVLLDAANISIKSIEATQVDQLGNILGDGLAAGDSFQTTAKRIAEQLEVSPDRSYMIANTEYSRAMNDGAMRAYVEAGVSKLGWLSENDDRRCEECEANQEASPIMISDEWPSGSVPVHPNCRCAVMPVDFAAAEAENEPYLSEASGEGAASE